MAEKSRPKDLELAVGGAVRRARNAKGLTLAELSKRSGVSSAMLSKIERGQVSASLSTLDALARTMNIPIANLFADTVERKEVSFVKAGSGIDVRRSGSTYGHAYTLIGRTATTGLSTESYIISISDPAGGQPLFQHSGIEFIQITDGRMTYRVGEDLFTMGEGDTLTFDSEMPHGPQSIDGAEVTFLTVIVARTG